MPHSSAHLYAHFSNNVFQLESLRKPEKFVNAYFNLKSKKHLKSSQSSVHSECTNLNVQIWMYKSECTNLNVQIWMYKFECFNPKYKHLYLKLQTLLPEISALYIETWEVFNVRLFLSMLKISLHNWMQNPFVKLKIEFLQTWIGILKPELGW